MAATEGCAPAAGAPGPRAKRVLIVEDEALTRLHLETIIAVMGYEVCGSALGPRDAIDAADALHPDLVVMDIGLGEGPHDGIQVAAAIRQLGIPALYLSAHADADTRRLADATRPLGFIAKPFSLRELRDALRRAADRLDG